jgi:hypothetical protein
VLAEYEGEEGFAIAFKPQYLLDGIGAAAVTPAGRAEPPEREGGQVTLRFTTPDKPAVITGSPGFRYLLAPMRT